MADVFLRERASPLALLTRRPRLLALATGVAAGLGQVPFSLVPLALAALVLAFLQLERAGSARRAAALGWWIGTGYFATTLNWIVEPFLIDIARHGWMAPFALVFCATGFALFWGAAFGLAHRLSRPGLPRALAFAVALGGAEMLRSYILTGFPWALVGYVWSEGPGAQLAAFVGSYGLTVLTLLGAGLAGVALRRGPVQGALAFAALWLLPLGLGALRLAPEDVPADAPVIRLVQPDAPQDEKWDPDRAWVYFSRALDFTAAPGEAGPPALTVWPETSVPYLVTPGHPALVDLSRAADGRPVAVGAQRLEGDDVYNSLLLLGEEGAIADTYDKPHLVPFGEYMPLAALAGRFGLRGLAEVGAFGFAAGPGPHLVDLGPLGQALPLICYEAIFPQDLRGTERPGWLLQITNDAWFGTFSGPFQHLAQARMRAIELGLPLLRAANTGITGVVDAHGRLGAQLGLGQAGFLDVRLPRALPPTLYARTGDTPLALLLIVALLGLAWTARRNTD
ncbi:apolipoprotein N-acyltransferase [Oceaniglobus roseus]|uniref:apolipoprotein N-acyltransferase n=1 Tax=Oceaniglobus roseus TaxID=1737570 RepID=UPI001FE897EB|nr:apolipoprotein N-acyltransferase [Kandeliimicrobium roseum]